MRRKLSLSLPAVPLAWTRSFFAPCLPVAGTVMVTGALHVFAVLVGSTARPAFCSASSCGSKRGLVGRGFFTRTVETVPAAQPGTLSPAKHIWIENAQLPLRVPSVSHDGSPSKQRNSRRFGAGGGG